MGEIILYIVDNPNKALTVMALFVAGVSLLITWFVARILLKIFLKQYQKFDARISLHEKAQEIHQTGLLHHAQRMNKFTEELLKVEKDFFGEFARLQKALNELEFELKKQDSSVSLLNDQFSEKLLVISKLRNEMEDMFGRIVKLEGSGGLSVSPATQTEMLTSFIGVLQKKNAEIEELKAAKKS